MNVDDKINEVLERYLAEVMDDDTFIMYRNAMRNQIKQVILEEIEKLEEIECYKDGDSIKTFMSQRKTNRVHLKDIRKLLGDKQ